MLQVPRSLRPLLAGPLLGLLLAAPASALGPAQGAVDAGAIQDAVDGSIAWLHTQQDPATGEYGRGPADTAWVLVALGRCHRGYRSGDGPFVDKAVAQLLATQRADGAFAPEDAPPAAARRATSLVLDALEAVGDREPAERLARATSFLGDGREPPIASGDPFADQGPAAVRERAAELLAARHADGSWGDGPDAVRVTTERVLLLGEAARRLKAAEPARAREVQPLPRAEAIAPAARARIVTAQERGARYLLNAAEDGLWGAPGQPDAGFTAMVLGSLETLPEPRPDALQAAIDHGLEWLLSLQHEDGSIHQGQLANYVTSAAVLALVRSGREEYAPAVARARDFLVQLQADEGEGYTSGDRYYGGVGYGDDQRPDLSNLQLAMEALSAAGLDPGDEAFVKAIKFLERSQNRSESNDLVIEADGAVIKSGNDGGAGYAPGESKAGYAVLADGTKVPRSYGSMTYALLKGYLFAGLDKDDPRVEAAWKWCVEHYTLDVNPGFEASSDPAASYQGLFYYFYTMARALDLYGQEEIVDSAGVAHPWRAELAGRIVSMQRQDGSWINVNSPRWYEGNPTLATAYALLVLDAALP